jgi:hypothetical protein
MSGAEREVDERRRPDSPPAAPNSVETVRPSAIAIGRTLVVGVLIAVAGAWIASTLADHFRILENVETGEKFRAATLVIGNATRNAAIAYALLGAILSLGLAITAGVLSQRFSVARTITAGIAGVALGGFLGAASASAVTPYYFHRLGTADVTLSVLVHLAIWSALGAAAGLGFAIGRGARQGFPRAFIGGITGGALAALLFDVGGAFFPLAKTERPLAELADTRLAAAALLSVSVVLCTVIVAIQEPRVKIPNAVEK